MINHELNRLINFAQQRGLIKSEDKIYVSNILTDLLKLNDFHFEDIYEELPSAMPVLDNILDYAVKENMIEDTVTERDLFDTRIMNCLMPRPSDVISEFNSLYLNVSPEEATNYYYNLSKASNYIRTDRIEKNIIWKSETEYGDLDITINLSKPEKDPKEIAKAKNVKSSSYPKCLLCKENEGFAGHLNHPARQTHRIIPLDLETGRYYLQYSPYTYYNEHCIILNAEHVPMKIDKGTFKNLLEFTELLPHYFAGSNADLPIVGGSILSHDHYQGGHYTFAMEKAPVEKTYTIKNFEDVNVGRVKWPMSVIRLNGSDKNKIIELADIILKSWRKYSDEECDILSFSDNEPHNTITPIARRRDDNYELDLVLRNNRTTDEYPLGIFHPHNEVHHIKKENIGLIEVMGLAVLPARLKKELGLIKEELIKNTSDISEIPEISNHADWYKEVIAKYDNFTEENTEDILKKEVGLVFEEVLNHAGVYKRNEKGMKGFDKFISQL